MATARVDGVWTGLSGISRIHTEKKQMVAKGSHMGLDRGIVDI